MLENIKLARSFVAGATFGEFQSDRRTSYAVLRCLEIISEASRKLPTDLKTRHPNIAWTDMAGAGSVYRHQYNDVQDDLVWKTVQEDLEPLRVVLEQELERLTEE
jgi:uncharacterized protein with HEPN domain